jgi:hypothetical protein
VGEREENWQKSVAFKIARLSVKESFTLRGIWQIFDVNKKL